MSIVEARTVGMLLTTPQSRMECQLPKAYLNVFSFWQPRADQGYPCSPDFTKSYFLPRNQPITILNSCDSMSNRSDTRGVRGWVLSSWLLFHHSYFKRFAWEYRQSPGSKVNEAIPFCRLKRPASGNLAVILLLYSFAGSEWQFRVYKNPHCCQQILRYSGQLNRDESF